MMIIYIAGIQNVPHDVVEAAAIDGASFMTTVRRIIIPMVMPSFTICTFLTLSNSFKLFDQNLSLTAGRPAQETAMLALDIYDTFYGRSGARGFGQAKAVIFFVLVAAVAVVQLRMTRTKEVEG
jgi:raffinose/stachyose/melibiose transport system permease protein